ncbi:hypothetical protein PoB_006052000 [Plakobranchus ocellatus]|uniref:REM-1 domain-containing protein n=1 Tax=Plakobranchus ocellatus TaxID=259542 RepID=A0AAV4CQ89_9GAST|nr:hypothetical protein PoB_006052000 [Plakobranchus ocellatus]
MYKQEREKLQRKVEQLSRGQERCGLALTTSGGAAQEFHIVRLERHIKILEKKLKAYEEAGKLKDSQNISNSQAGSNGLHGETKTGRRGQRKHWLRSLQFQCIKAQVEPTSGMGLLDVIFLASDVMDQC